MKNAKTDTHNKMSPADIAKTVEFRSVVDDYRAMCFWNFREDFAPDNDRQLLIAAKALEDYGDLAAFRKAGEMRKWVSRRFR